MNHEIVAADPLSQMPVAPPVLRQLSEQHNFSDEYLQDRNLEHQNMLQRELGRVGLAIELSTPLAMEPAPVILGNTAPDDYPSGSAEAEYDAVRQEASAKFDYDSSMVSEVLRKLGPTNQLRSKEGFDGGIDLGHMIHMLQTDYAALPKAEQLPEKRMTEGLLREEMALLWRPTTPKKFENNPHKAFMLDLEDPNLFSVEQLATLSESDRWKMIGSKLSEEAADVFQAIAESPTASLNDQLTASCRLTDMKIRSLRIQAGMSTIDKSQKQGLYEQIQALNNEYLANLANAWAHPALREGVVDGQMFELFVIGQERAELIKSGETNKLIRLATPREDNVHKEIRPYYNKYDEQMNLSVDAVVEDTSGNFVKAYQVKAMPQSHFEELQAKRPKERGTMAYLPDHTQMRFADSYPRISSGVDLSVVQTIRAA